MLSANLNEKYFSLNTSNRVDYGNKQKLKRITKNERKNKMFLIGLLGLKAMLWAEDQIKFEPLPKYHFDDEPDIDLACNGVLDFESAFK